MQTSTEDSQRKVGRSDVMRFDEGQEINRENGTGQDTSRRLKHGSYGELPSGQEAVTKGIGEERVGHPENNGGISERGSGSSLNADWSISTHGEDIISNQEEDFLIAILEQIFLIISEKVFLTIPKVVFPIIPKRVFLTIPEEALLTIPEEAFLVIPKRVFLTTTEAVFLTMQEEKPAAAVVTISGENERGGLQNATYFPVHSRQPKDEMSGSGLLSITAREGNGECPRSEDNIPKLSHELSEASRENNNNGVQDSIGILPPQDPVEIKDISYMLSTTPEGKYNGDSPKAEKVALVETKTTLVEKEKLSAQSAGESIAVELNSNDQMPGEMSMYVPPHLGIGKTVTVSEIPGVTLEIKTPRAMLMENLITSWECSCEGTLMKCKLWEKLLTSSFDDPIGGPFA
ncbi:hypothetical protein EV426DRAFT_686744 [Tirmania nivea]|nr:hypothetical protein EV426DRAFT_686744 [Tirmania nivea]